MKFQLAQRVRVKPNKQNHRVHETGQIGNYDGIKEYPYRVIFSDSTYAYYTEDELESAYVVSKPKIKVGDRVRISLNAYYIDNNDNEITLPTAGQCGVVKTIDCCTWPYGVQLDNGDYGDYLADELELIVQ